ncbi:MAG TPA: hypothetical protein VHA78_02490 [Candidatus Peribacteraceae bacterium]|nr:hypothetical protein [Candidatus Peribacteraceae bacterium]
MAKRRLEEGQEVYPQTSICWRFVKEELRKQDDPPSGIECGHDDPERIKFFVRGRIIRCVCDAREFMLDIPTGFFRAKEKQ